MKEETADQIAAIEIIAKLPYSQLIWLQAQLAEHIYLVYQQALIMKDAENDKSRTN